MEKDDRKSDKVRIDVDLARRLVAAQFPQWQDLPVAPVSAQGVDNKTFRLGADMSVRLPVAESYDLQVEKEMSALVNYSFQSTYPAGVQYL